MPLTPPPQAVPRPPSTDEAFIAAFADKRPGFIFTFAGGKTMIRGRVVRAGKYAYAVRTIPDAGAGEQARLVLIYKSALATVEPLPPEK